MRAPRRTLAVMIALATTIATGCAAKQEVVLRDDSAITKDVRDRLSADPAASKSEITVDTKAGVVRLDGEVTESVRASAERIARDTPGVRSVDNNMRFGGSAAPAN